MGKVIIEKTFDDRDAERLKTSEMPYLYSQCQLEVPGIGRIRTGKVHPNFHLTKMSKPEKIKRAKKVNVKTCSRWSGENADVKMEIAYNRS